MKNCLLIALSVIFFISCKEEPPVPENKFIELYAAMVIMQDTSGFTQAQIREKVLSSQGISEIEYKNTVAFYNKEPEKWQNLFVKIELYVDSLLTLHSKDGL